VIVFHDEKILKEGRKKRRKIEGRKMKGRKETKEEKKEGRKKEKENKNQTFLSAELNAVISNEADDFRVRRKMIFNRTVSI
jgi:hypothetical protein